MSWILNPLCKATLSWNLNPLCKATLTWRELRLEVGADVVPDVTEDPPGDVCTSIQSKLTDLCWNRLSQNNFKHTLCEIKARGWLEVGADVVPDVTEDPPGDVCTSAQNVDIFGPSTRKVDY